MGQVLKMGINSNLQLMGFTEFSRNIVFNVVQTDMPLLTLPEQQLLRSYYPMGLNIGKFKNFPDTQVFRWLKYTIRDVIQLNRILERN